MSEAREIQGQGLGILMLAELSGSFLGAVHRQALEDRWVEG